MSSLGSGEVSYTPDRPVIHFGSPTGSRFGSSSDFSSRHPDFKITNK